MTTTNLQTFLVGGAVRDELLGRPVADRDWVVIGATVEQLLNQGFQQIGRGFPCFLHPQTKEEYALARTERKSGKGHHGFICEFGPHITLEEDLSRRDLTINAIAKSADGRYIDPYGGRDDLKAGILRHVSAAFVEDPLRVLRVARFAARYAHLGFTVHPETLDLMRELVAQDELSQLTAERVWKEMSRALTEASPDVFFRVLRACGALKVILPELDKLFGIPQPPEHHPEIDTGEHVMLCIDIAAKQFNTLIVTWAVLLHDLGKGLTPEHLWPKHVKHEINGVPLAAQVCNRFRVPREFLSLALLVSEYHLQCHRINEMRPESVLRLLHALDVFRRPQRLTYFVQACEADARGRTGFEDKPYPQAERLIACAKAADEINVKPLLAAGYEGPELIEQINQKRLQAIAQTLNSSKG